jgi:protein tyrosine/serine phosphatase
MRRNLKVSIFIIVLLFALFESYSLYMEEQGNFHTITPGKAYRSAQLDRDELEYYIRKHNIRSILNLRGKDLGKQWYIEERQISALHSIAHYDIELSAYREPNNRDVDKLINIFRSAPRPILIHCLSGVDRTGLASAMWKVIVDKESKTKAWGQLSLFYGHMSLGKQKAMDNFFANWRP